MLSSHLIVGFDDAVVAPLVNDSAATVPGLEIPIEINGEALLLVLTELAGVQGRSLKRRITNLLD